ncbi:hypothetical protein AMATHDRAFT_149104 [Amanita thiersii Skay4041]|uniref:YMC020W-like alpha/beta hydrolase domain-containing protein n=1 Tax=Amanita thiersii Skay4041 TaxID=703135 RepID=A0A2A9NMA2_9AGAR|nr:hypothetical protein AMATHDRAFT_149104 [Amanita thiersii Skay4041]
MSVGTEAVGRISGNSGSGGSRSVESNAGGTVAGSIEVKKGQVTHQEVDQAQSLTEERVSGRNGSAWYNPWAWYGCSSVDPKNIGVSADTDVIVEEIKDRPLSGDDADEKTANVGAEGSQSIESSPLPLPQERKEDETVATATSGSVASIDVNPISASIETHRYGWASFFASTVSRTLVVKSITAAPESACEPVKVDENGIEVMDIDDGDVPGVPEPQEQQQERKQQVKMSVAKKASLVLGSSGSGDTNSGKNTKKPASEPVLPARSAAGASSSKKQPIGRAASPSPNLVLPSWQDTFHTAPRNVVPKTEASKLVKTMQYVSGMLFSGNREAWSAGNDKGKQKAIQEQILFPHFGKALPKAWDVVENAYSVPLKDRGSAKSGVKLDKDVLRGCRKVVVIGVHGWFPGAVMRTVLGEPTGTSSKFVNMMTQALEDFQTEHGVKLEKVTKIPLEGEGTIKRRVEKLYTNLLANQEWIDDIHSADAILVATHSQGSIVTTHLLNCLIQDKHIRTSRNSIVAGPTGSFPAGVGMDIAPAPIPQRVCCLALCGIHLGPLRYLSTNSLFQPYFQYIESPAARELFEFQNTENEVSKEYVQALGNVLNNGTKMLYVASLNDQVVPIYSGLFTAASHPLILRALYIDGDAYHSSDFLANILVLLLRILNSGIPDSGLLVHLSEATAGSLNGVGHSTAYEEIATYALAVKYLFMTNNGLEEHPELALEPFNARQEQNDYEIPWALRDVIADERVRHFFGQEISQLRDAFREWHPRTSILRDLKRKLQPIQRLPPSFTTGTINKL